MIRALLSVLSLPADRPLLSQAPYPKGAVWREEETGLNAAFLSRTLAVATLAIWLAISVPAPRLYYYLGATLLFFLLGLVPHLLRKHAQISVIRTAFVILDVLLIVCVILLPISQEENGWPLQMRLRQHDYLYLLLYLCGTALSYAPRLVLWAGMAIIGIWGVGFFAIYTLPDTYTLAAAAREGLDLADAGTRLRISLNPRFATLTDLFNQLVLTAIMTALLTVTVWRSRRHMLKQVNAEAARAQLSRYFSPDVAERLVQRPARGMGMAAQRPVAVLFVDIVGFTGLIESLSPNAVIELLRSFHSLMASIVFRHGGTLDKYLGDGLMATFGTHQIQEDAAHRAFQCALAFSAELKRWNAERQARGETPITIGIGGHFGPGIVGDVGTGKRLEFTVVGDTVNLASRLERLTRDHEAEIAFSDDLVQAVGEETARGHALAPRGPISVRGRSNQVAIWTLPRKPEPAPENAGDRPGEHPRAAEETETAQGELTAGLSPV